MGDMELPKFAAIVINVIGRTGFILVCSDTLTIIETSVIMATSFVTIIALTDEINSNSRTNFRLLSDLDTMNIAILSSMCDDSKTLTTNMSENKERIVEVSMEEILGGLMHKQIIKIMNEIWRILS